MQYYQTDHSSGARLIGGEMLDWSDRESVGGLGVLPVFLHGLLARKQDRILLVGPRAAQLLESLPAEVEVDVVVRSLPDARELSAIASLRPRTTVWCGGVERLVSSGTYSTVVVLEGPGRVLTPDSPGMSTGAMIGMLGDHLSEDGVLAVVVANGMSVASWLELPLEPRSVVARPIRSMALTLEESDDEEEQDREEPRDRFTGENANDRWWHGATGFADREPYFRELDRHVAGAGLTLDSTSVVYPHPDHPSVLVDVESLDEAPWSAMARSRAVAAQNELFATAPALADPTQLVDSIFEAGLGPAMAPAWLLVAHRGTATGTATSTMAWSDGEHQPFWSAAWTMDEATIDVGRSGSGTGVPITSRVAMEGPLERAIDAQPWPCGPSVESLFRTALESGNHKRIRHLVRTYSDWVRASWGALGTRAMAATMDNVTVTAEGWQLTDASWRWHRTADPEVVVARGVRRAAMRLLRAGLRHPWRTDISPDELAVTLMIMQGADAPEEAVQRAARVDAEWQSLLEQVPADERDAYVEALINAGRSQFTAMPAPAPGYRETVVRSSRMATELEVRQGQVEWLEAALRMRETRMASVERNIDDIRASMSFKLGRVITSPARRVAESARRGILRMVPADLMEKAEKAARRLLK